MEDTFSPSIAVSDYIFYSKLHTDTYGCLPMYVWKHVAFSRQRIKRLFFRGFVVFSQPFGLLFIICMNDPEGHCTVLFGSNLIIIMENCTL